MVRRRAGIPRSRAAGRRLGHGIENQSDIDSYLHSKALPLAKARQSYGKILNSVLRVLEINHHSFPPRCLLFLQTAPRRESGSCS